MTQAGREAFRNGRMGRRGVLEVLATNEIGDEQDRE